MVDEPIIIHKSGRQLGMQGGGEDASSNGVKELEDN